MSYRKIRIWDLPTRVFHWLLALGVLGLLATGWWGAMDWHFRLGYSVLMLLVFRIVWGFVGGHWSRFSSFVHGPKALADYLAGRAGPLASIGHSPTGALSVFALLAILVAQVSTGLMSDDEIANAGPAAKFVSNATVSLATGYHKNIGQWIVLALVVLHVLAIVFYWLVRKQNLTGPMITGDKRIEGDAPASRDSARTRVVALTLALIVVALVGGTLKWAGAW